MSVQIKNLTVADAQRRPDGRRDSEMTITVNRIPLDGNIYDLYIAPNNPAATPTPIVRSSIVKCIRIVNTQAEPVLIDLFFTADELVVADPSGTACCRRRIAPPGIRLDVGVCYIDESDLTLEPGFRIQAQAQFELSAPDAKKSVDYVISGVERDVTV